MSTEPLIVVTVSEKAAGERLDSFLAGQLQGQSRSALQRLIENGDILLDGKPVRPSHKLVADSRIQINFPAPVAATPRAEEIPLDILYEDSDLIVINKPAGMTVHPGAGVSSGTLVNALLAHCKDLSGIGGEIRPGIVHRLDKGTSGVLVAAKNDQAHRGLAEQFSQHKVKRLYHALVFGVPEEDTGKINGIIGRHPTDRLRLSGKARNGKQAVTNWRVLERFKQASLIRLRLETGRTHQIRVHLSEAGMPIIGDPLYPDGGRLNNLRDSQLKGMINKLKRQALHAYVLGFIHPTSQEYMEFSTEPPQDFMDILDYLRPHNSTDSPENNS